MRKHLLKNVVIDVMAFFNKNGDGPFLLCSQIIEKWFSREIAGATAFLLPDVGAVLRLEDGARFVYHYRMLTISQYFYDFSEARYSSCR